MNLNLEIDTTNKGLLHELFGKPLLLEEGHSIAAPDGVSLVYKGMIQRRGLDFPTTLEFILVQGGVLLTDLFASWLYDKLKERAQRVRVNGSEVAITLEAFKRIFETHAKK